MARPVRQKQRDRYHHGDLRRGLVEAALQLIEEQGPSGVTTRALARRLGVSHAAPAHHFKDREALLREVASEGFHLFADALESAARGQKSASARLVAIGRAYVRFAVDHPSHFRLMFGSGFPDLQPHEPLPGESGRALEILKSAIQAVAGAEATPGDGSPTDELALTAWSLVHGMAMLWIDGPARVTFTNREEFDAVAEKVMRGIVRRMASAGAPTSRSVG